MIILTHNLWLLALEILYSRSEVAGGAVMSSSGSWCFSLLLFLFSQSTWRFHFLISSSICSSVISDTSFHSHIYLLLHGDCLLPSHGRGNSKGGVNVQVLQLVFQGLQVFKLLLQLHVLHQVLELLRIHFKF